MKQTHLKLMTYTALTAALCVIGSFIKVPGFITTAALDTVPALVSVLYLPPLYSGFVAAIGHLATGLYSGMPLGVFHALIAVEMLILLVIFNVLHKKQFHILKWSFVLIFNGILAPLPFYFLVSPAFYIASVPSLLIATAINCVIAIIVMPMIEKIMQRKELSR